jgi:hypothetical protein
MWDLGGWNTILMNKGGCMSRDIEKYVVIPSRLRPFKVFDENMVYPTNKL